MKEISMTPKALRARAYYSTAYTKRYGKVLTRLFLVLLGIIAVTGIVTAQQYHGKYFNNVDANGVILDGYDAVAFFNDNKPVKDDDDKH